MDIPFTIHKLPSIHYEVGQKPAYTTTQKNNQSVENAGVAFVKGAHKRNEFFEKINKYDEQDKGPTISGSN